MMAPVIKTLSLFIVSILLTSLGDLYCVKDFANLGIDCHNDPVKIEKTDYIENRFVQTLSEHKNEPINSADIILLEKKYCNEGLQNSYNNMKILHFVVENGLENFEKNEIMSKVFSKREVSCWIFFWCIPLLVFYFLIYFEKSVNSKRDLIILIAFAFFFPLLFFFLLAFGEIFLPADKYWQYPISIAYVYLFYLKSGDYLENFGLKLPQFPWK